MENFWNGFLSGFYLYTSLIKQHLLIVKETRDALNNLLFYFFIFFKKTNNYLINANKMTATPTTVKSCPVQGSKKWIVRDIGWYKTVTEATDTVIGCFQGVNKNHRKDVLTAATKHHYYRETSLRPQTSQLFSLQFRCYFCFLFDSIQPASSFVLSNTISHLRS